MRKPNHRVTVVVRESRDLTDRIRAFELADPDDWDLPPFTAGSHIDLHLESGAVRSYSLFGDPAERNRFRIAVQREDGGRGASVALHRTLARGDLVSVSLPRNHFPLQEAKHHILIAGGIGITPLYSMIQCLRGKGASFELHYLSRSPDQTAFVDQLAAFGSAVRYHYSRIAGRVNVADCFARATTGTHVYCCGPQSLVDAVRTEAAHRSFGALSTESFASAVSANEVPFAVRLMRSGMTVPVPAGQSILEAVRRAGVDIPSSCEGGVCLECKVRVLGGTPAHRDIAMTATQRGEFMTPCVSGSASDYLDLDL